MRIAPPRHPALALILVLALPFLVGASPVAAAPALDDGEVRIGAIDRLGIFRAPLERFALSGGKEMKASSIYFSRTEISPVVDLVDSLPHGKEIEKLKLYVATDQEIESVCGVGTMACYDPGSEQMLISGQSYEVAGIPRAAVIAHEYGHHIANNRRGGLWPALYAGTPRWSTYEHVCELTRNSAVFPGDRGAHYWDNPGEAFAQSYSQMVYPQSSWHYSALMQPDPAALARLRQDVVDPWEGPHKRIWRQPENPNGSFSQGGQAVGVGDARAAGSSDSVRRAIKLPVDGRISVRLKTLDGGRYKFALIDPADGSVLARSQSGARSSISRLSYASCGHRSLLLEATSVGVPRAFEAKITTP